MHATHKSMVPNIGFVPPFIRLSIVYVILCVLRQKFTKFLFLCRELHLGTNDYNGIRH